VLDVQWEAAGDRFDPPEVKRLSAPPAHADSADEGVDDQG